LDRRLATGLDHPSLLRPFAPHVALPARGRSPQLETTGKRHSEAIACEFAFRHRRCVSTLNTDRQFWRVDSPPQACARGSG
jgi:hypothetical protein